MKTFSILLVIVALLSACVTHTNDAGAQAPWPDAGLELEAIADAVGGIAIINGLVSGVDQAICDKKRYNHSIFADADIEAGASTADNTQYWDYRLMFDGLQTQTFRQAVTGDYLNSIAV